MRLLVVEDDLDLAEAMVQQLTRSGHVCDRVASLGDARQLAPSQPYDLIILDINLPDGSGLCLLRALRQRKNMIPVLALTARLAVDDRVEALDAGADDYLGKPFEFRELEARVRAILRRRHGAAEATYQIGAFTIDTASHLISLFGEPLDLTRREQSVLEILLLSKGRVLLKDELHARLFGLDEGAGLNAVELYVARLRKKLPAGAITIKTLRGIGYQALADERKPYA